MVAYVIQIPRDIQILLERFIDRVERTAKFAYLLEQFGSLPTDLELPQAKVLVSFGTPGVYNTVKKNFTSYALPQTVVDLTTATEVYLKELLVMRRLIEHIAENASPIAGEKANEIRKKVYQKEARTSLRRLVELIIDSPSSELIKAIQWIDSIYALRKCLVHRDGVVDEMDVNSFGKLRVVWRKIAMFANDQEIIELPFRFETGGTLKVQISDEEREYSPGELIAISVDDCQNMAFSLCIFGNLIAVEAVTQIRIQLGLK